jgi:hypothetical protein
VPVPMYVCGVGRDSSAADTGLHKKGEDMSVHTQLITCGRVSHSNGFPG